MGIEPTSSEWKSEILAFRPYAHFVLLCWTRTNLVLDGSFFPMLSTHYCLKRPTLGHTTEQMYMIGFEPTTYDLKGRYSTVELHILTFRYLVTVLLHDNSSLFKMLVSTWDSNP